MSLRLSLDVIVVVVVAAVVVVVAAVVVVETGRLAKHFEAAVCYHQL